MSPTLLTGPELLPESGTVKHIVLFLHGVGADGNDLIGLAHEMDIPDTFYFSPDAPFPCDMAPYGRQWFSLQNRDPRTMLEGIKIAAPMVNTTIEALCKRFNLTASDVALVGFSQGSMMSLYTAPRRAEALAGVVGIAGAMLGAESFAQEIQSRPPICLIHGTHDQVVPFGAMAHAQDVLTENNVPVEAHARPMLGHGIDEPAIARIETFLKKCFGI